jgi:hypothetical protein
VKKANIHDSIGSIVFRPNGNLYDPNYKSYGRYFNCSDLEMDPYPEACIKEFYTTKTDRTNIAENWRQLENTYHTTDNVKVRQNIEKIAFEIKKFYELKNEKGKLINIRPQRNSDIIPYINLTKPPPVTTSATSSKSLHEKKAHKSPSLSASKKHKPSTSSSSSSSSAKPSHSLYLHKVTASDDIRPVKTVHFKSPQKETSHDIRPVEPVHVNSSPNDTFFRSLWKIVFGKGGKSNKRQRGRKIRTRKYKKH